MMTHRFFQRLIQSFIPVVGTVLIVLYVFVPFYWVLSVSVTPEQQFFARELRLIPRNLTLENYFHLFKVLPFAEYFRNSTIVALSTTALSLSVAIPAAYAFARFRFRGRRPLLLSILMLYMIPPIVLIVPLLVIFNRLRLYNTFPGLIVANVSLTLPFAIWLLVGFFASLPREIEDAALVDGCTPLGALRQVVLPLSLPGIVAAGLFVFIVTWNEFLFAFTFTSSEGVKTLPVAMRPFVRGEAGVFWGTIMAAATLTTIPVIVLFLFFQRYLIGGLSAGSVKG